MAVRIKLICGGKNSGNSYLVYPDYVNNGLFYKNFISPAIMINVMEQCRTLLNTMCIYAYSKDTLNMAVVKSMGVVLAQS